MRVHCIACLDTYLWIALFIKFAFKSLKDLVKLLNSVFTGVNSLNWLTCNKTKLFWCAIKLLLLDGYKKQNVRRIRHKVLIMCVAMFYIAVWLVCLIVVRIRNQNWRFRCNFWWNWVHPDGKKFPNLIILCVVKVQLLPIMFEPVRFCCLHYFVLQALKLKN